MVEQMSEHKYDEAAANEFHMLRNEMRQKLYLVLSVWFDGALRLDPDSEMMWQLADAALGLELTQPRPPSSPAI